MSLDFVEDYTTTSHPLNHGSLAPLSRLVALVHRGEVMVGLATCVVLRSAANGNALAEETVSRLMAEIEPK